MANRQDRRGRSRTEPRHVRATAATSCGTKHSPAAVLFGRKMNDSAPPPQLFALCLLLIGLAIAIGFFFKNYESGAGRSRAAATTMRIGRPRLAPRRLHATPPHSAFRARA